MKLDTWDKTSVCVLYVKTEAHTHMKIAGIIITHAT